MNSVCVSAFAAGTDALDTTCMGTCRDLLDTIISSCDVTVSQTTGILLVTELG